MNRRSWVIAGGLAGAVVAGVVLHARRGSVPREPGYNGRPATFWISGLGGGKTGADPREALRAMGTNALPFLVLELRRRPTRVSQVYQTIWLNHPWLRRMPAAARQWLVPEPAFIRDLRHTEVLDLITALGPEGEPAIPDLIAVLRDDSLLVRRGAALALGRLHGSAQAAVPALVDASLDPDAGLRRDAVVALGRIGPAAKAAVPRLLRATNDPDAKVRIYAGQALELIDAEAAKKAGVK